MSVQRRESVSREDLNPAHLSVVVLKVSQLEALLQFGLMPHPELIERPFCLVQLRQEPGGEDSQA